MAGALAIGLTFVMGATSPAKAADRQVALYKFKAEAGRLHAIRGRDRAFVLVLRSPRAVGRQKLRSFIRDWKHNGFRRNPPSAAVVVANAPKDHDVQIMELRRPRLLEGGDVRFHAHADRAGADGVLQRFQGRADPRLDPRFGDVSLLIDPTRLATISITFQALTPVVAQQRFVATFTNASFAAAGAQGNTVTLDGAAHVEFRDSQIAIQSGSYYPVAGGVSFQLVTQDPFITGSVVNLPPGMSGYFIAGPDTLLPLKAGGFKIRYD